MTAHIRIASELVKSWALSATAFRLYALLLAYQGAKASAFPSIDRLCQQMKCSKSTVAAAITDLEKAELLVVERSHGRGHSNTYSVPQTVPTKGTVSTPFKGCTKGTDTTPFTPTKGSSTVPFIGGNGTVAEPLCEIKGTVAGQKRYCGRTEGGVHNIREEDTLKKIHYTADAVSEKRTSRKAKKAKSGKQEEIDSELGGLFSAAAPSIKTEPKPRPRNPMFDAIVEATGADANLHGGKIGTIAARLQKAGYTPDDVAERFLKWWYASEFPGGKKTGEPPTPEFVFKYIDRIRTTKLAAAMHHSRYNEEAPEPVARFQSDEELFGDLPDDYQPQKSLKHLQPFAIERRIKDMTPQERLEWADAIAEVKHLVDVEAILCQQN